MLALHFLLPATSSEVSLSAHSFPDLSTACWLSLGLSLLPLSSCCPPS